MNAELWRAEYLPDSLGTEAFFAAMMVQKATRSALDLKRPHLVTISEVTLLAFTQLVKYLGDRARVVELLNE